MADRHYRCKCGYCGTQWFHTPVGWNDRPGPCKKCGEAQKIDVKEEPKQTGDVFGYRFSPPFPETPKRYTSDDDNEYPSIYPRRND